MYWRVSKIGVDNKELPEGYVLPELYKSNDDYACFIKYDHNDLLGRPWCIMRPFGTRYGAEIKKRFSNFSSAFDNLEKYL